MHLPQSIRVAPDLTVRALLCAAVLCGGSRQCVADAPLADPTHPSVPSAAVSASHPEGVRVQAILDRDGRRLAIVDGKIVRPGDRLPWGSIEEVTSTGIRYVAAGRARYATLEVAKLQVRHALASAKAAP